MAFTIIDFVLLVFGLLCTLYYFKTRRPKNYPPGPMRIPIFGNMFQIGEEPHKTFMEMSKKYGDIIAIDLGPYRAVVINEYKLIKEALNDNAFTGRPKLLPLLERSGGKPRGVIFNDGQGWVDQRRFILKNLRDFGFGKNSMEALVHIEVEELIEGFRKDVGKPITTQGRFNAAVLNALWSIVSGQRYAHDDPRLGERIKCLTSSVQQSRALGVALFFPFLRKILPTSMTGSSAASVDNRIKTKEFMVESITSHKETFQADSPQQNLVISMLDLFVAGAETTSTTLTWAFLLLSINQEIQEKLHQDIKNVVGISRLPSLADRPQMPYTEAVIMEVLRFSALVPTAVQHRTTEDVKFHGYLIPADTLIIPNLYCALRDEKVWGDPENFRPARFLSPDETKVVRHEAFIPFSYGKRVCLGETLARDELFLFMTSLFQRFNVGTDPNSPKPDPNDTYKAAVLLPKPHILLMRDRFDDM